MRKSTGARRVLAGNPEGRRLLGTPMRILEDNIKIDLQRSGMEDTDWIDAAQHRDK
jgi:hypothetical protein